MECLGLHSKPTAEVHPGHKMTGRKEEKEEEEESQFSLYVMDGGNEQRVTIKFCFKAGVSATETLVLVQKTYGNEAVNRSNIFRWYS
jgi:hypothetical protein